MLRLQGESTDFSDLQPEGRVFRQDPPAQTQVRKGSGVTVWISKGPHVEPPPDVKPSPTVKPAPRPPKPPEPKPPEPKPPEPPTVTVPPLYGFTIERAHDSLRRVGLDTGRVNRIARAGGRGTVEHQEPHEGAKLHPKDVVDLTIAVPPPMVKVPPVVGLTLRAAEASLDVFGLETGVVSRQPVKVGNSGVLSQDPPAGALVEAKSAVALTIGVLIVEPPVAVPDLARQTRAGADSLLVARGLRLGAVFADSASATLTVVSQDPLAGDSVVAGTPVSVRLGGGDGPYFRVPNVVRLSLDSARASLRSAGLTRVAVDGFLDANAVVVLQNPQEGTSVPASAVIALVADSLMIPVPYLLGLTEEEARNRAAGDRLSIGLLPSHRGFVFRTVVDSQVPARPASIRASGAMSVQLVTPIVPPVVLAAFGLGALGLVVVPGPRRRILDTLRRIIKRPPVPPDPGPHPPPAPSVTLVPVVQGQKLLTLDDAGRDSLVKNVLSLSFDVTRDAATLHVNEPTITKPGSWRDA
jgi:beta-lactam-binding protein with PASTA domain